METFLPFFPNISTAQWEQLQHYQSLLLAWNAKINLISRKDTEHLFEHHILPILPIQHWTPLAGIRKAVDVGTGGGIPGIPLAILYPKIHFTLIDSIHKKIIAVQDMIESLQLTNASAICDRLDHLKPKADLYVGRGVTAFSDFTRWIGACSGKNPYQILYWTGGEIHLPHMLMKQTKIFDLEAFFNGQYGTSKKILYLVRSLPHPKSSSRLLGNS